ncbi:MAG: hypothetical protein A2W23_03310 [Planctomycetes bacterium RBG_16_43_13]|nr:MAG: hypothetical protein A2W23_03310 [Planctomycetes bacterium RBG_16_43_13]
MKKSMWVVIVLALIVWFVGNVSIAQEKKDGEKPIDPRIEEKIHLLIKQLGDEDQKIRTTATDGLIKIGRPAITYLKKIKKGEDAEVDWRVELILGTLSIYERTEFSKDLLEWYPLIYKDLASEDAQEKFKVFQKVIEVDQSWEPLHKVTNKDIAGIIGELLLDGGKGLTYIQRGAISLVCSGRGLTFDDGTAVRWRNKIKEAAPYIKKLLKDEDSHVRHRTVSALADLGAKDAIDDIKELLSNEDHVRKYAVVALGKLGVKEMIPDIRKVLKEENDEGGQDAVRPSAIFTLIDLNAKEAIPDLKDLLKDRDKEIRSLALIALDRLDGVEKAIPEIVEFIEGENDAFYRGTAIVMLGKAGAKEAIPMIKELLKDKDASVRGGASLALGLLGVDDVIPAIVKLLRDKSSLVRGRSAFSLGLLDAKDAIPTIKTLLKDSDTNVRGQAGIALVELGAKDDVPKKVIDDIKPILRWGTYEKYATSALKELGVSEEEIEKEKAKKH